MGEPTKGWHVNQFTIPESIDKFSEIKLPIIRRFEDADGDLWQLEQDRKRLADLFAAYNLDVFVVDKYSGQVIELQFIIKWKDDPDGLPEPE